MRRFRLIPLIVAIVFAMSSCTFVERILSNPEGKSGQTINNVVEAIKTKDSEKIISLFSKAVKERVDLSDQTEDFFDFIEGEIVSTEKGAYRQTNNPDNGILIINTWTSFFINTSTDSYRISVSQCVRNEKNNNEIGVTSIFVVNMEDFDSFSNQHSETAEGLSVYVNEE